MPKHISETLLSACGCHTALVVHANICQVTVQTEAATPNSNGKYTILRKYSLFRESLSCRSV